MDRATEDPIKSLIKILNRANYMCSFSQTIRCFSSGVASVMKRVQMFKISRNSVEIGTAYAQFQYTVGEITAET